MQETQVRSLYQEDTGRQILYHRVQGSLVMWVTCHKNGPPAFQCPGRPGVVSRYLSEVVTYRISSREQQIVTSPPLESTAFFTLPYWLLLTKTRWWMQCWAGIWGTVCCLVFDSCLPSSSLAPCPCGEQQEGKKFPLVLSQCKVCCSL